MAKTHLAALWLDLLPNAALYGTRKALAAAGNYDYDKNETRYPILPAS